MIRQLVILSAMSLSAFAAPIIATCGNVERSAGGAYGQFCVGVNGSETRGPVNHESGDVLVQMVGDNHSLAIAQYDVDPFFNWTFTTSTNGVYVVNFVMPYIAGPYTEFISSASGTGTPGKTPVTAKSITVDSLLDGAAIGQTLVLANTTINPPFSGVIGQQNSIVGVLSKNSGTFGVKLTFTHSGSGSLTFNGRVELTTAIPEPATFGLAGVALLGALLAARRAAR